MHYLWFDFSSFPDVGWRHRNELNQYRWRSLQKMSWNSWEHMATTSAPKHGSAFGIQSEHWNKIIGSSWSTNTNGNGELWLMWPKYFKTNRVLRCFSYYLEPASPLKSINTTAQPQQQQQPLTNGVTKTSHQQVDNSLAVLKSIQLTPPAANNRHHHRQNHAHQNGFSTSSDFQNNNFFHQNGATTNGSIKSDSSNDFIADFSKASIHNSNNSLNSTESGGQVNGKTLNGTTTHGDVNDNFADFENNKIYNAAGT